MRITSWFLVTVLILLLGISLIDKPSNQHSGFNIQEAAEVQMEPVYVVAEPTTVRSVPFYETQAAEVLYAEAVNSEMERSEDRTVYFAVVNSSHSNSNRLAYRGGPYPLMCPFVVSVATEHKFMYTTATTEEVPFPLKGPYLAGRFTDILTEALVDLRSPT
jgi:hypothetical protein